MKKDIHNLNITNKIIRNCKSLGREQKEKYIELGRICLESMNKQKATSSAFSNNSEQNVNTDEDFQNHISKFAPHLHFKLQNEKHERIKTGVYDSIDQFIGQTFDVNEPTEGDDQVY